MNHSVKQKLELIRMLESGISVAQACEEYSSKKVFDIHRSKDKLQDCAFKFSVDASQEDSTLAP